MTDPRPSRPIAVYGASGHTARFVLAELQRRGLPAVAVGRRAATLPAGVAARVAAIDDAAALDAAFAGCAVVINCAGPFLDTALPVAEAALRAGAHYVDVTAEQAAAMAVFERLDAPARAAGVAAIPAAGFYGGLADLLASALLGPQGQADDLTVAVALDRWWPTAGTRKTGERNTVPRLIVDGGRLVAMPLPAARSTWRFGDPHGEQPVIELPFSETITISRHLRVQRLRALLTQSSLEEIRDETTPPPAAVDALGRSAQRFEMVVQARQGGVVCTAAARGRDIYAVSAPLVVEAAVRLMQPGFARAGALALGEAVDARDFLNALAPLHLALG
jgi:hypothetical protein